MPGVSQERLASRQQRPVQHQYLICLCVEDRLEDIRRRQRHRQASTHIVFVYVLGSEISVAVQASTSATPRQGLDQRAVCSTLLGGAR